MESNWYLMLWLKGWLRKNTFVISFKIFRCRFWVFLLPRLAYIYSILNQVFSIYQMKLGLVKIRGDLFRVTYLSCGLVIYYETFMIKDIRGWDENKALIIALPFLQCTLAETLIKVFNLVLTFLSMLRKRYLR